MYWNRKKQLPWLPLASLYPKTKHVILCSAYINAPFKSYPLFYKQCRNKSSKSNYVRINETTYGLLTCLLNKKFKKSTNRLIILVKYSCYAQSMELIIMVQATKT